MTPTERARLLPHASGLIAAVHADNSDDIAYQLGEIAQQLNEATTWALLVTLASAVDPDITLAQLRPDTSTLTQIEQAWSTRAASIDARARRTNRSASSLTVEGRRIYARTRKGTAA